MTASQPGALSISLARWWYQRTENAHSADKGSCLGRWVLRFHWARVFQVKLHLQRITAHRLDGGNLGRLHPHLGIRRDPQLSFLVAIAREGSEVGSDLPAAIYSFTIQYKHVTHYERSSLLTWFGFHSKPWDSKTRKPKITRWNREPDGRDFVTGSATVSLIKKARRANSRSASSNLEPYDWFTASLKTNFSTGAWSLS